MAKKSRPISKSKVTFEYVLFDSKGNVEKTWDMRDNIPNELQRKVVPAFVVRSFTNSVLAARRKYSEALAFADLPADTPLPIIRSRRLDEMPLFE